VDAPLEFIIFNIYPFLVGDLFPMNPATAQFPNTVFTFAGAIFAYLIGATIGSRKLGIIAALSFALIPWLAPVMRSNVYLQALSCLLQVSTIYFFTMYFLKGDRKYAILAPLSFAIYFSTGFDWPAFGLFLFLFTVLSGNFKKAVLNVYNIFPIFVIGVFAAWFLIAYPQGGTVYKMSVLYKPFNKVFILTQSNLTGGHFTFDWNIIVSLITFLGIPLIASLVAIPLYKRLLNKENTDSGQTGDMERIRRSLFYSLSVWFLVALVTIIFSAPSNPYYLYVVSVPSVLIGSLVLDRLSLKALPAILVLGVAMHAYAIVYGWSSSYVSAADDDKRVLAVSAYLLENRPDLLAESKFAYLPRQRPANVSQYVRGANDYMIMPHFFPKTRKLDGNFPEIEKSLRDFIEAYEKDGTIAADWLVLTPEIFKKRGGPFFKKLYADPQIHWEATFKDQAGREIWLGEVIKGKSRPLSQAPVLKVDPLAEIFTKKYDRRSHLVKNLYKVIRY